MTVTTHEKQNARQLLEQKRQAVRRAKGLNRTTKDGAIRELMDRAKSTYGTPPKSQEVELPLSVEEIKRRSGITSLSDLKTDHMTPKQRKDYNECLDDVRYWRQSAGNNPGHSFILCSRQYGIGKTHIAKAVMGSFATICMTGEDFNAPPIIEQHGIMLTSRQCMELLKDEDWKVNLFHKQRGVVMRGVSSLKVIVLDDIGREGILQYVKQESENQEAERQARYYEIVNWCYENGISLFITSNMQPSQLATFFNEATWDRLNEMAPKGCMSVLENIPSYRKIMSGR